MTVVDDDGWHDSMSIIAELNVPISIDDLVFENVVFSAIKDLALISLDAFDALIPDVNPRTSAIFSINSDREVAVFESNRKIYGWLI